MAFTDLLRGTLLLLAAAATLLGVVTLVAAARSDDPTTLIVASVWWVIAIVVGAFIGVPARARDSVSETLSSAKTSTLLPNVTPTRLALGRLWPLLVFTVAAGGVGFIFPPVAAVGTGYALLVALAFRYREAAVLGIEDRDGVRFYVESASVFDPLRLIRTPGLTRDRAPAGHPPPPPAAS